jgi:hypothetical protein
MSELLALVRVVIKAYEYLLGFSFFPDFVTCALGNYCLGFLPCVVLPNIRRYTILLMGWPFCE